MLPRELVDPILDEVDLASMCVLHDTNRFWRENITETDFQHKLQELCPWFEPQFSHRKTWKACSVEYVRRMKGGAKFAPKLRLLDEKNKFKGDLSNPQDDYHNPHDFVHLQCNHFDIMEEGSSIYTSAHDIEVDLSDLMETHLGYEDEPLLAPEPECQVFSYPHMVIIIYAVSREYFMDHCHVVVKFKRDGASRKPEITHVLDALEPPSIYTLGAHTFLFYTNSLDSYADTSFPAAMYLYKTEGFVPIDVGGNDLKDAVLYDGLFSVFGLKKHYCVQANLNSPPARDASWIKHLFRCTGTHRDPWWGSRYVVLVRNTTSYMFDVRKGVLQSVPEGTYFSLGKKRFTWRDGATLGILVGAAVLNWVVIYISYLWMG
ncbi:hypothetical protein CKK34_3629 [Yarrowia sp. E02]|nr:hypothetical protein CKK34_3629 [Yarrowia sp. E02]